MDGYWRYKPIVEFIKKINPDSIVEVGCGDYGITRHLKREIVGVDLKFKNPSKLIKPVWASCSALPFRKSSFDVVLSTDMLEHISKKLRKRCVKEMLRVAKRFVILGVPCGEGAARCDKSASNFYRDIYGVPEPWLAEHIKNGLPAEKEIEDYLKPYPYKKIKIVNLTVLNFVLKSGFWLNSIKGGHIIYVMAEKLLAAPLSRLVNFGETYRKVYFILK